MEFVRFSATETERALIKQRQAKGIAAAKLKGVQFGCKRTEFSDEFEEYCQLCHNGEISLRKAAEDLRMNYTTFIVDEWNSKR